MERVARSIVERIKKEPGNISLYSDLFECIKWMWQEDRETGKKFNAEFRTLVRQGYPHMDGFACPALDTLAKESYHIAAYDDFDSYLIYLEWMREPRKKFYMPRRRVLKKLVADLQDLEDGTIQFLSISLPPRIGKSTLCIMFMTWVMGRHPEVASVMSGHSDKLTKGFYKEILNIISNKDEYLWHEVFPTVAIASKSAEDEAIDLGDEKRFPTLTCRSVEGTLTGAVEIGTGGILYCDDMVKDFEESVSPDRMQAKWDAYVNTLKDRKKDGAKELMVGTRWNVLDPIGRTMEQYKDDPTYRFVVIPALDENDESNFEYQFGVGFTTEYYRDMRESTDDATWWAKYMGQPYVREGLLFPRERINWYNGVLPDIAPDRIVSVCDVAWGGGDFLSMPVAYVYGKDVYIQDVAFSDKDKTITVPIVCGKIKQHNIPFLQFEANNGGSEFADKVSDQLKIDGVHANISSRRTSTKTSKLAKIVQYAPDIMNFWFIDEKHATKEYREFMKQLCNYVMEGKNAHDDAPDSLAMLCEMLFNSYGEVRVLNRMF